MVSGKNLLPCGTGEAWLCHQLHYFTSIRGVAPRGIDEESLSLAYAVKMSDLCKLHFQTTFSLRWNVTSTKILDANPAAILFGGGG